MRGFFVCEYLRACKKYSSGYRQFKEAKQFWYGIVEKATDEMRFRRTVGDISKFVLDQVVHEVQPFFLADSELGMLPEFEPLRKWDTMLRDELRDYKHPVTF